MNIHDYSTGELPGPDSQQWTTAQLQDDFSVEGFAAPFVIVRRKVDGAKGTLQFHHSPRIYFGWEPA